MGTACEGDYSAMLPGPDSAVIVRLPGLSKAQVRCVFKPHSEAGNLSELSWPLVFLETVAGHFYPTPGHSDALIIRV